MLDGALLAELCSSHAGAVLDHPFRPEVDVYKVGGKMFALVGPQGDAQRLSVKADPERVEALQEEHACVGPGYHLDKRHWVSVDLAADPPQQLVEELIEDSYDIVRASLPKSKRP